MMDISVESLLYKKTRGCLIGDVIGTPKENMAYGDIEAKFGWVDDFEADGTDDTVMKNILAEIQNGQFAKEWMEESRSGGKRFDRLRSTARQHPIEEVGEKLRSMMPWIQRGKLVDKSVN